MSKVMLGWAANILWCMLTSFAIAQAAETVAFTAVTPGRQLVFPKDHGAHPEFRTEWWYVTGHLDTDAGKQLGFQITFFRTRTGIGEKSKSSFAPSQILFAHAAVADVALGKLRHDDRIARQGWGNTVSPDKLNIALDGWTMRMVGNDIVAEVKARDFALSLTLTPAMPPLKQGEDGFSRKGPLATQASYYVSLPHLRVSGHTVIGDVKASVRGTAWFDHEWSSDIMSGDASGWDWLGANFDDGGALMAFQMRAKNGSKIWASGTRVASDGKITRLSVEDVAFNPLRVWQSPRTGARWPVAMTVQAGTETFELKPWMDDQELDSARSTGITYWEGAVDVLQHGKKHGRAYLELTGYAKPIKF